MTPITTITYIIGTVGMLAGLPIAVRLLRDNRTHGHFGYLLIIPGFAALMYALMALDVGTIVADGYPVPVPRYVDWLITTPVLVGYTAHVAGMGRRWIVGIATVDVLMICLGGVAIATTGTAQWVAFGLSSLCHLALLVSLYRVLPPYAAQQPSDRRMLARLLQNHVGLLWIAYPLVWIFGPGLQMVSAVGLSIMITFMDVVAKVPFVYFVYQAREVFAEEPSTADDAYPAAPAHAV
jgi:sensory rhodopsin